MTLVSRLAGGGFAVASFDEVVRRFETANVTFTEEEALRVSHWALGEDARLREDARFRQSPWGRWMLSEGLLANDALYASFTRSGPGEIDLESSLEGLGNVNRHPWVFCPADPRFVLDNDRLRLAASELSDEPLVEDALELEKYVTHLPLHSLEAVAASEPAGEWGPRGQEEAIETLGWVRIRVPGHRLNDKMFVAEVRGSSMESWRREFGRYAVFELWPEGTRQNRVVLVRGAFSDPDLGTYALKKYVGDARDEDGRHRAIHLVSLNSDKSRFPDITLNAHDEADLSVVAWLVEPLSPSDYGRTPKSSAHSGRRDLSSRKGREAIRQSLGRAAERFFGGRPLAAESPAAEQIARARFICLEAESGGLHLEAGPLSLPPLVKKLVVATGEKSWTALASNFRNRSWRIAISPSTSGYEWKSPGLDDLLHDELSQLSVPGLSGETVTTFRVDALGVGRMLTGETISPGQSYRFVVPPALAGAELPLGAMAVLEDGWKLWEVTVPATVDLSLQAALARLGLESTSAAPSLTWVVVTPEEYGTTPSGEAYPCFSVASFPILQARGAPTVVDGEATLFVCGKNELQSLPLPRGAQWAAKLEGLVPGQYVVELLYSHTRFAPARLAFAVQDEVRKPLNARLDLRVGETIASLSEDGHGGLDADLALPESRIEVTGPPLWPVSFEWITDKRKRLRSKALGEDGRLDVEPVSQEVEVLSSSALLADFVLDFAELGRVTVRHRKTANAAGMLESVREFVTKRVALAEGLRGQFPLLRAQWLDALLSRLGYQVQDLDASFMAGAPEGAMALLLREIRREGERLSAAPSRALVLVAAEPEPLGDAVRQFAFESCTKLSLRTAIVTDGLVWRLVEPGRPFRLRPWDLRALAREGARPELEDFLYHCAVEV